MKRNLSYSSTDVLDAVEIGNTHEANRKCATGENASPRRPSAAGRLLFISSLMASAFGVFYFRNPTKDFHATLRLLQYNGPPSGYGPSRDGGDNDGMYGGQPSKGNTNCADLPVYGQSDRNPCHYNGTISTLPPSTGDLVPPAFVQNDTDIDDSESITTAKPFLPEPPDNIVNLTVFVAQDPETPSVAHRVAKILTNEMNRTIENMAFYTWRDFPQNTPQDEVPFDEELIDGSEPIIIETIETRQFKNDEGGNNPGELSGKADVGGDGTGDKNSRRRENRFSMIYVRTSSAVALKESGVRWWWELDLWYICKWEEDGDPVGAAVMDAIRVNMTNTIRERIEEIQSIVRNDTKREELLLGLDILDIPGDLGRESNDTPPPVELGVDVGEWSWTRYLGFVVFLSTCSGLIISSQFGSIRRRRKVRQQVWGNLASEEGVEELLKTGWILREDRMEVYDKTRVGYRDDDSMLIGGFEQREPGPGTVIMTPTLTTHEDTSTRGPSTTTQPVSTRHEDP